MEISASLAVGGYAKARAATRTSEKSNDNPNLLKSFTSVLQNGDDTARATMTGTMDPHALAQALSQTELAVETAVVLRDKVVEAYQEIMRMPI